jgi:hypothetical protein
MSWISPLVLTASYRKPARRLMRGVPVRLTVGNDRRPHGPDGPGGYQSRIFAQTGSPNRGAAVCAMRVNGGLA